MKKKFMLSLTIVFVLLLSATSYAKGTKFKSLQKLAAERRTRELTEFSPAESQLFVYERETLRYIKAGKIDDMMDLLIAEDAIVCPPNSETISGRETQKVLFKKWLGTKGVELDYEPIDARVSPSEDMGWVHGLVRWKDPN